MEILLSFLIGLAFPVGISVVSLSMIASGAKSGEPAKVMALLTLVGTIVWVVIFFSWGIGAGFIAFGGWTAGLVISLITFPLIGLVRRMQLGNPSRHEERNDLSRGNSPYPQRSPARALVHIEKASSSIKQIEWSDEIDTSAATEALVFSADQAISAIEADWLCGDGHVLLAVAYDTLGSLAAETSETVAKECAVLAFSVMLRWAKLKERNPLFFTSPAGISLATSKFGIFLSKLDPASLRPEEALEDETFAIDRQHVVALREKLEYLVSPKLPTKVRAVRLESTKGCQRCQVNFLPTSLDSRPFDFLGDEAAHTSDFDHVLLWEGEVEVPDVFDIANIRETCAVFIKGLLAVKRSTTPGVVYRFGIKRPAETEEQMRLLGIAEPLDRMMYRNITGGPSGIAEEIGRFLRRHKCKISEEEIRQTREGLSGFDLRMFNIALTINKM